MQLVSVLCTPVSNISTSHSILKTFLPHLAGSKAASQVGPKIVLDHVRVYMYKLCLCAHHWLYTMLLTTHLRRGLTRTEK